MKDRKTTSEQGALEGLLKEVGIPILDIFNYDTLGRAFTKYPVLAVTPDSELPTKEEISSLVEIALERVSRYFPEYRHGFYVEGASTLTVIKQNGQWKYHRMTWQGQTWSSKYPTLTELRVMLNR
ncbi:hypothetical protein A2V80_03630 [Candidatus Woesebacteria bacterium RBG_16_39_8b]|uniref:Uncharacterized protein n=1 Tax=Candidatus Woesebacteria bacterium RBG_16_39_8b TaxID=1802482 RepID=A0A1F7X9E8_9BACT|nr:MAG: hypothetical protein A2V80_03630 [Candidatus Woesebacteria bacterium RBG_16_39_8b]